MAWGAVDQALDLEPQEGFPEEVAPGRKSSLMKGKKGSGQASQKEQNVLRLGGSQDLMKCIGDGGAEVESEKVAGTRPWRVFATC